MSCLFSLNDSFAHVKRELEKKQYQNEMMNFMLVTFRKFAGSNRRKTSTDEYDEIEEIRQVPLAEHDEESTDEL